MKNLKPNAPLSFDFPYNFILCILFFFKYTIYTKILGRQKLPSYKMCMSVCRYIQKLTLKQMNYRLG